MDHGVVIIKVIVKFRIGSLQIFKRMNLFVSKGSFPFQPNSICSWKCKGKPKTKYNNIPYLYIALFSIFL